LTVRFFAVHDAHGNISSLVGSPATGPVMMPLQLSGNDLFSEVKLPARLFDPAKPKTYPKLTEISSTYVVELPLRKPAKLVKKGPPEPVPRGRLRSLNIYPNSVTRPQVPRFDVSLKEPTAAPVYVTILLVPNTFLGSVAIPPGETLIAMSAAIPANVLPGVHMVTASAAEDDTVSAELRVVA
jgi:hypothetical protein